MTASLAQPIVSPAGRALERGRDRLLAIQHERGFWKGELETNVTMDAEDLLLREFLGIRDDGSLRDTAAWIRSRQRDDGGWAIFHGGPPDLSTTIEAYIALRLAGDSADALHMQRAAALARELGGIERVARVHAHLAGALRAVAVGATPRAAARGDPAAVVVPAQHLRLRVLGAPDDRAAHGGGVAAPAALARLRARRAAQTGRWSREQQSLATLGRSLPGARPRAARLREAPRRTAAAPGARALRRVDPEAPGGRRLLGRDPAAVGVLDHGAAPARLPARSPGAARGTRRARDASRSARTACAASRRVSLRCGTRRSRWSRCATPASRRTIRRCCAAAHWLLDEEIRVPGDWAVRRPQLEPGGWAFEFANDNYPDIDDTAEVILALRARGRRSRAQRGRGAARGRVDLRHAVPRRRLGGLRRRQHQRAVRPAAVLRLRRGDRSAERRRHRARDRDARRRRSRERPAHACAPATGCCARRSPTARGSGAGASTTSTAPAPRCRRSCAPASRRTTRRSAAPCAGSRRTRTRTAAGARTCAPTQDAAWRGRGTSTPSQTAWALLALLAAGERGAGGRARCRVAGAGAARGRRLGRARLHRHRLPGRLLHPLPPLPACTSR